MSRNVCYGTAFQKDVGESLPVAWDDSVAFLSYWSGRHAWQLHSGLGRGHCQRLAEKSGRPSG